jgi:hypothetical protein
MLDHHQTQEPNDTKSSQNSTTRPSANGGANRLRPIAPFGLTLVKSVLPAYLAPAVLVSIIARLIPDRATGQGLARAAPTTIAIPSALAALAVIIALRWYAKRRAVISTPTLRIVGASAAVCGLFALGISGLLVANHHASMRLFGDAIPSALISSAITAWQTLGGSSKIKSR